MIYENVELAKIKLNKLIDVCNHAIIKINNIAIAEGLVTLAQDQKDELLAKLQPNKDEIVAAYNDVVEVYTATEELQIPESNEG